MTEFKAGDKVKATESFVASFTDEYGAVTGLQSEGTVQKIGERYVEVRLDNGFHIGQVNGTWFLLPEELTLL